MKAYKLAVLGLIALAAVDVPAEAAWNNVFQPTCFGRRRTTSAYCPTCPQVVAASPVVVAAPVAPACSSCQSSPAPVLAFSPPPVAVAPPAPQTTQQCTTNYVQRSYYQPVTTYESRSFYEPVTTMQTSFYYEAVTSYQTSFYPDPCSCGYIAKSCPVTSFQLRQKNCPVQSWVQRCAQVPVTSYKQMFYLEPQTTCCNTTIGAAVPCPNGNCPQTPQAPPVNPTPSYSPPPVIEQPRPAPAGPSVGTTSNWQPIGSLTTASPAAPATETIRGQAAPNTHIVFVNAATGARATALTNAAGQFDAALPAGSYHVYLANQTGAAYHSQITVAANRPVHLVSN